MLWQGVDQRSSRTTGSVIMKSCDQPGEKTREVICAGKAKISRKIKCQKFYWWFVGGGIKPKLMSSLFSTEFRLNFSILKYWNLSLRLQTMLERFTHKYSPATKGFEMDSEIQFSEVDIAVKVVLTRIDYSSPSIGSKALRN